MKCRGRFVWWMSMTAMIAATACGGSSSANGGSSGSGSSSLSGSWTGSWRSNSGVGGTVTMNISQTGNALSGTGSMTNSTCLEAAKISGTVNGDDVLIDVTSGDTKASTHLTITAPGQLDGTYDAISAGLCSGDHGIVDITQ